MKNNTLSKAFGGYTYVIPRVSREEAKELLDIAKKNNINECFSKYLPDDDWNYLTNVCIDERYFGKHLMAMIASYEITCMKTGDYREGSMSLIREMVDKANQYCNYPFLNGVKRYKNRNCPLEQDRGQVNEYTRYISSLNAEELSKEFNIVDSICKRRDEICENAKKRISTLRFTIKERLNDAKEITKEDIQEYLNQIFDEYCLIESQFNDLHMVTPTEDKPIVSKDVGWLVEQYKLFHNIRLSSHESAYNPNNQIISLLTNLEDVFNLFNSQIIIKEMPISLDRYKYLLRYTATNEIPEYIIGKKNKNGWDYRSVLERLYLSLETTTLNKLYSLTYFGARFNEDDDLPPLLERLSNADYHLGYIPDIEFDQYTKKLTEEHKNVYANPWRKLPIKWALSFLTIDNDRKQVYVETPVSVNHMEYLRKHHVLSCRALLDHFDEIVIKRDFILYNLLIEKIRKTYD
jgi:hypothetical protein